MKVYLTNFLYNINENNKKQNNKHKKSVKISSKINHSEELRTQFNDYLLSFKARVDKGLERFYETNESRMPSTVRRYVESLDDKSNLTPLAAQQRAFIKLEDAKTVEDIRNSFPDEELFFDLKNPEESKATRGLLNSARENRELFELYDIGILKDKQNLTVYLVKKIFLEGKTIDEINTDLENDLDEDFKADFKMKNKESKYIYGSTLKSLGIKVPEFEYQQSLRYTRDGYSDYVGEKISQGQREFWDSLDMSERTSRAKKSLGELENWWASLSTNEKLDMIADNLAAQDMIKLFKKTQRAQQKQNSSQVQDTDKQSKERKHIKVGSEKLKNDELFIKWVTSTLNRYKDTLSEADKDTLHLKTMRRLAARWANMTPQEKTDYISRMRSGAEPVRYAMIDAWNHSVDLIKDLSLHLRENQIFKPSDLLFSTQEFSAFQSRVMSEFWQNHPEYAVKLGENIIKSQQKVETAISNGTFEELKVQINRDKQQRIKDMDSYKAQIGKGKGEKDEKSAEPDYKKEFKDAYSSHVFGKLKSVPKNYYNDLYDKTLEILPESAIRAWTKNLRGEVLSSEEIDLVRKFVSVEHKDIARYNRALEAAVADTLYEFTKDASVYEMSNSDVKTALHHLEKGDKEIVLISHKVGKKFELKIKKDGKVNAVKINNLYELYKQDLDAADTDDIIHYYFDTTADGKKLMDDYIKSYGKSALILFSTKSTLNPDVKYAFFKKFMANMPKELKETGVIPAFKNEKDIKEDHKIIQAKYMFSKRFEFLPQVILDTYFKEFAYQMRKNPSLAFSYDDFIDIVCKKRKTATQNAKIAVLPKLEMRAESKLKLLAFEQAMADVLYEATGNEDVFALNFENLCDNLEILLLAKTFPTQERTYSPMNDGKMLTLSAKKKPNIFKLKSLYTEYMNQVSTWVNEDVKNTDKPDFEQLLYILNPDENMPHKDIAVAGRMAQYGFAPEKFEINPNSDF